MAHPDSTPPTQQNAATFATTLGNGNAGQTLSSVSLLDRAVQMLKERGPMKAKNLADALELPNARSLSMQLQWAHDRARCDGGKWKAV